MDVSSVATEVKTVMDPQITPAVDSDVSVPIKANASELAKVRDLVLKAHPDIVPDLVAGNLVDELIASVDPARSAYQRIADQVRQRGETPDTRYPETIERATQETAVTQPPVVPAGGAPNVADPDDLAPASKIARALADRKRI